MDFSGKKPTTRFQNEINLDRVSAIVLTACLTLSLGISNWLIAEYQLNQVTLDKFTQNKKCL